NRQALVRAHAEGNGRRKAPTFCLGNITPRDTAILDHAVDPHTGSADALVDVERGATPHFGIVLVEANADLRVGEVLHDRAFGHDIDVAAATAAPIVGSSALEDL